MKVQMEVPDQRMRDMLVGAFEGGSNYWYMIVKHDLPAGIKIRDFKKGGKHTMPDEDWNSHYLIPFVEGCALIITTEGAGDEGDKTERRLDRAALERGIQLMAEKSPGHFGDMMSENDDATTADVFLQYCVLGELVYG